MNEGRKITDLEQMESIPAGTSYLAEAGDGSGPRQLKHEKLVEEIGQGIGLGNLKELDTKEKGSVIAALNEVNKKAGTVFEGTDGIKAGTAGVVPAPKPDEVRYVLGANGKWVPPGEGGALDVLEDRETLEANTEKGKLVDALVVKELNNSLGGVTQFIVDPETHQITGYKTAGGADTVFPFRGSGGEIIYSKNLQDSLGKTFSYTFAQSEKYRIYLFAVKEGYAVNTNTLNLNISERLSNYINVIDQVNRNMRVTLLVEDVKALSGDYISFTFNSTGDTTSGFFIIEQL